MVCRRPVLPICLLALLVLSVAFGVLHSAGAAGGAFGRPPGRPKAPGNQTYSTPVRRTAAAAAPSATAADSPTPTVVATTGPVGDVLTNPGFELGNEGWYLEAGAGSDPSEPHSGDRALRLPARGFADQRISIVPGGDFVLSAWGKLSAEGEMGRVGVTYWDADGNRLESDEPGPIEFTGTSYTQQSLAFSPPDDVAAVAVFASKGSGDAVLFIDDIALTRAGAGTPSPAASPTGPASPVPAVAGPLFSDDFESGSFARWSDEPVGIALESSDAYGGEWSAEAGSDGGETYIRTDLSAPQPAVYVRFRFKIVSQGSTSTVNLARVRTSRDRSIAGVFVSREGRIGILNDVTKESVTARGDDDPLVTANEWHEIQLHVQTGDASLVEVWYDGAPVGPLTRRNLDLGREPTGRLQIGENASSGKTYDVLFDDVLVDVTFIPFEGLRTQAGPAGTPVAAGSPISAPAPSLAASPVASATPTETPRATPVPSPTATPGSTPAVAATATMAASPPPVPASPPVTPTRTPAAPPAASPTSTPVAAPAASPAASPASPQAPAGAMFRGGAARDGVFAGEGPSREPAIAWTFESRGGVVSSAAVADGVVFVGSLDSGVYALDASDGSRRWRFDTDGEVASSPAVVGGLVYVGSSDGYLYAIDASTGERRWRARAGQVVGAPAVDGGMVYVGSWDGALYAFDAATGERRWRVPVDAEVYSSPAVAGGIVYGGGVDGTIHAVDAETGNEVWTHKVDGLYATPAVAGGVLYVGDAAGTMYALDARSGGELWRSEASGRIASSAAVASGLVVFGSDDGRVYALRAADGTLVWRASVPSAVNSSPSVAGDVVYVGTVGGRMLAFDLERGDRRWSIDLDGEILASPVIASGALYVGTNAGAVYRLDDESP